MEISDYQFIEDLKKLSFIEAIFLYGSRARGDHRERSDIDLAIDCPRATEDNWLQIIDIIEDADTLLKIDCLRYDTLEDIDLKKNIDRDKQIIFKRN